VPSSAMCSRKAVRENQRDVVGSYATLGKSQDCARLKEIRAQLALCTATMDVIIANSHDQASVDAAIGKARMVLNIVGPFVLDDQSAT
jgi:short subunit dehydrogenase-like uncharacterized protein